MRARDSNRRRAKGILREHRGDACTLADFDNNQVAPAGLFDTRRGGAQPDTGDRVQDGWGFEVDAHRVFARGLRPDFLTAYHGYLIGYQGLLLINQRVRKFLHGHPVAEWMIQAKKTVVSYALLFLDFFRPIYIFTVPHLNNIDDKLVIMDGINDAVGTLPNPIIFVT